MASKDRTMLGSCWPPRIIAATLLLTGSVFAWWGGAFYRSNRTAERSFALTLQADRARIAIDHVQPQLRLAAQLAAASGDLEGESRYHSTKEDYTALLEEAAVLVSQNHRNIDVQELREANTHLFELESRVFAMIKGNDLTGAREIIRGDNYKSKQAAANSALMPLTEALSNIADLDFSAEQKRPVLVVVSLGIPALLVGWWITLRLLKRWQLRDDEKVRRLTGQCEQLTERIAELTNEISKRKQAEHESGKTIKEKDEAIAGLEGEGRKLAAAAEQARLAEEDAIGASRAKSGFLAKISRDIRSPLTTILGYTTMLMEMGDLDKAPTNRVEALYTIKGKGEQLLDTINDVLELCELELNQATVERNRCALMPIIDDVHKLMLVWADARGLRLLFEYVGELPETIETDPKRLGHILISLLGNAVKFTLSGDVRLIVRLVRSDPERPILQFDVLDSGIGMRKEQASKLFQPFANSGGGPDPLSRGTGLGLSICKRYADMLGGDIQLLDTLPGIGTRIRLTLSIGPLEGTPMIVNPATPTQTAAPSEHDSDSTAERETASESDEALTGAPESTVETNVSSEDITPQTQPAEPPAPKTPQPAYTLDDSPEASS